MNINKLIGTIKNIICLKTPKNSSISLSFSFLEKYKAKNGKAAVEKEAAIKVTGKR